MTFDVYAQGGPAPALHGARVGLGRTVALCCCSSTLHPEFANTRGASIPEAAMWPSPRRVSLVAFGFLFLSDYASVLLFIWRFVWGVG
jgi:hypothetical protein